MSKVPGKSKPKSTQADYNQRVSEVQALLLEGRTRSYICNVITTRYKVGDSMVDKYIGEANKIIKEINSITLQENLSLITSNLWNLYRSAISTGNLSEANKILMNIAKLRGLNENTINLIVEDKREHQDLSDADLDKLLNGDLDDPDQL